MNELFICMAARVPPLGEPEFGRMLHVLAKEREWTRFDRYDFSEPARREFSEADIPAIAQRDALCVFLRDTRHRVNAWILREDGLATLTVDVRKWTVGTARDLESILSESAAAVCLDLGGMDVITESVRAKGAGATVFREHREKAIYGYALGSHVLSGGLPTVYHLTLLGKDMLVDWARCAKELQPFCDVLDLGRYLRLAFRGELGVETEGTVRDKERALEVLEACVLKEKWSGGGASRR